MKFEFSHGMIPACVGVAGLILTACVVNFSHNFEKRLALREFQQEVYRQSQVIKKRYEAAQFTVTAYEALYAASESVSVDEFKQFGDQLFRYLRADHPARQVVKEIGWIDWRKGSRNRSYLRNAGGEMEEAVMVPVWRARIAKILQSPAARYRLQMVHGEVFEAHATDEPMVTVIKPLFVTDASSPRPFIERLLVASFRIGGLLGSKADIGTKNSAARLTAIIPTQVFNKIDFVERRPLLGDRAENSATAADARQIKTRVVLSGNEFEFVFEPSARVLAAGPTSNDFLIAIGGTLLTLLLAFYLFQTKRQSAEFRRAQLVAERAQEQKTRFLANMTHEIRTPMAGILGMARLIGRSKLDAKQSQFLKNLTSSAESMLTIINDILDFTKADTQHFHLSPEPVDIRELVEMVCGQFAETVLQKKIGLRIDTTECDGSKVTIDPVRTRQILTNLIGNAVKFTSEGEVAVRVEQVVCGDDGSMRRLRYAISDTGIGIPKSEHERIFDRFTQADISTTKKFGGTGLGLAICRQLVEKMEGEIAIDSTPGEGTTFTVTVEAPAAEFDKAAAETDTELENERFDGVRILLVEDNPINQIFAQEILEDLGCEVEVANHGGEAMDKIAPDRFELILMDCQMPVMDGFEASQRICAMKADGALEDVPIIALTANAMQGDRERTLEAGMNEYLAKPLDETELKKMMKFFLRRSNAQQENPAQAEAKSEPAAAPVPAAEPAAGTNDLIDLAAVETTKARMKSKFPMIIAMFSEDAEKLLGEIARHAADGAVAEIVRPAHTMKSSSRLVGAVAVSRTAAGLEALCKKAVEAPVDMAMVKDEAEQLRQHFAQTRPHLDRIAAESGSANG